MTSTTLAALPTARRARVYWVTTLVLATECVVGGIMGALQMPPFSGVIQYLGYPAYFMTILGVWYVLAGFALLVPDMARLKEWAYAGLTFNYTGAAASHFAVGHGIGTLVAPLLFACLTLTSWALRPAGRREITASPPVVAPATRGRLRIVFWATTGIAAAELGLGGIWDVLRVPYVLRVVERLGYPSYLLIVMGVWKVPGAVALLHPRVSARVKEWAYAGAMFTYTGAIASHLAVGDGTRELIAPTCFAALTIVSWALRPTAQA